jgi:[ribosomal protein S18]-alanine N-acetyltransferase
MAIDEAHHAHYAPIVIQRMQNDDIETVADLDKQCFPTPWTAAAYYTEVQNPSAYYVVARNENRIVGYAGMWLIMDEAHITTIGVAPELRGRKIGERVLVHILEEATHRGIRRATLEVRRHNLIAQGLYEKYGFKVVAVRKGYYGNNNEDALVMWTEDMLSPEFLRMLWERREALNQPE